MARASWKPQSETWGSKGFTIDGLRLTIENRLKPKTMAIKETRTFS